MPPMAQALQRVLNMEIQMNLIRNGRKASLVTLAVAGIVRSACLWAQVAPGAGQLLQQAPQAPVPQQADKPSLSIPESREAKSADTTPIPVIRFEVSGNKSFDTVTLHELVASGEGHTLTLGQIDALVARISAWYHQHGYALSYAYIPAQSVNNGIIKVKVIEARYGKIKITNASHVNEELVRKTVGDLRPGEQVDSGDLERGLLLLQDLPGANAHAVLSPGSNTGESDLAVQVAPSARVTGQVGVDDLGDVYTGRTRGSASINVNNLLGLGDVLGANLMTAGNGFTLGQVSYQATVNGFGTRVGASYSELYYAVGDSLQSAGAHGTAGMASAWLVQPLIRSADLNLSTRLEYDHRDLDDVLSSAGLDDRRHIDSVALSLLLDWRDDLLGGGDNHANLSVTPGVVTFGNAAAQAADVAAANTHGNSVILNAGLDRLQTVAGDTALYGSVSWQYSDENLDSSQQWLLGGADSVRGYRVSTIGGSSGVLGTLELRHIFRFQSIGPLQGSVFLDNGFVKVAAWNWAADQNAYDLSSAGLGLAWAGRDGLVVKVQVAEPFGGAPQAIGGRPGTQVWAQLVQSF
jgi:hemolysin activation/secretion protein